MSLIHRAASQLARALDDLKVPYAIMGGSACFLLGSPRTTIDIDLVVDVSGLDGLTVDQLAATLKKTPGFTEIDEKGVGYFTPAVALSDGTIVPLEIFDPDRWSRRPQYRQVISQRVPVRLPDGYEVYVFSPSWLLREKISAIQGRGYAGTHKYTTDLLDIQFLAGRIEESEYGRGVLDFREQEQYAEPLRAFLGREEVSSDIRGTISKICRL